MRALLLTFALLLPAPALAAGPVVVELYTSQNCEACARANALAAGLAQRPDVLPLTFPVDYWDYLGWTDTLAQPEFAERQREHARSLGLRGLQTPMVVIDGAVGVSGLERGPVMAAVRRRQATARSRPAVRFSGGGRQVQVTAGAPIQAAVWLVRFDPRLTWVEVGDGPNRGRNVPHRNVVREMVRLGEWNGRARSFVVPASETAGLRTAVLVQAEANGRMLAAGAVD